MLFKKILSKIDNHHEEPSMEGTQNTLIRWYRYCSGGINLANEFKSLVIMLLGIYYVFKLSDPWLFIGAFVFSVIIFTIVGWYRVHKMDKVIEWLNIKFTTYYGLDTYNIQKDSREILESILKELKKKKSKSPKR